MQIISQCSICKHFDRQQRDRETCAAFPDGIPEDILANQTDHRRAVEGDRGIRWSRAADAPAGLEHYAGKE